MANDTDDDMRSCRELLVRACPLFLQAYGAGAARGPLYTDRIELRACVWRRMCHWRPIPGDPLCENQAGGPE